MWITWQCYLSACVPLQRFFDVFRAEWLSRQIRTRITGTFLVFSVFGIWNHPFHTSHNSKKKRTFSFSTTQERPAQVQNLHKLKELLEKYRVDSAGATEICQMRFLHIHWYSRYTRPPHEMLSLFGQFNTYCIFLAEWLGWSRIPCISDWRQLTALRVWPLDSESAEKNQCCWQTFAMACPGWGTRTFGTYNVQCDVQCNSVESRTHQGERNLYVWNDAILCWKHQADFWVPVRISYLCRTQNSGGNQEIRSITHWPSRWGGWVRAFFSNPWSAMNAFQRLKWKFISWCVVWIDRPLPKKHKTQ